uniref:Uncharacterized protein n=1 Tax=Manihot esculenta TaxID=3983 RepID=A0A2C9W8H9_MANES
MKSIYSCYFDRIDQFIIHCPFYNCYHNSCHLCGAAIVPLHLTSTPRRLTPSPAHPKPAPYPYS